MQTEEFEEGISLQELFQSIFSRLYIVVVVLVLSIAGSFVYLHYAVKQYQTTAIMIVEPITKTSSIGKFLATDFFNSDNDISSEIHLITNITNLEGAAQMLDLSSYTNSKGIPYSEPSALGSLKGKTTINNYKGTNIVEVSVTDENPRFAADFANAIAVNFNALLSEYGQDSKMAQIEFLHNQIPAIEQQLDEANDRLFDYKANTGIDFLSNSTASLVNHISYLQMRKRPLQLQIIKSESLLHGFQMAYKDQLPSLEVYRNDKTVQEILTIYGMAFDELIQFDISSNQDYRTTTSLAGMNNNINMSVNARIGILNSQMNEARKQLTKRVIGIASEAGVIQNASRGEYYDNMDTYCLTIIEIICNEVDIISITKTIEMFEQEFNKLPVLEKDLSKMQSDVDSLEAIRKELNSLLEQITLSAAAQNNNVKLVTAAKTPLSPVSPNSLLILAVSVLLGGALGVLLCLFLHMKDDRLHTLEDIKKIAGSEIPLLGWTPLIDVKKSKAKKEHLNILYQNHESYISQRYNIITSNLLYGKNSDKKIFMITSSKINEGKSSLTCNLSLYLAHLGFRVLILDGDLKTNSIARFFNLKEDYTGYVEQMQKGGALEDVCIKPVEDLQNLDILVPGKTNLNPSVFYTRTKYGSMFDSLKDEYDYIFIDAPPLEYASGLMGLLEQVDGIILCVRLSICSKTDLSNLIGQLEEKTDKTAGIIATGCALSQVDSYTKSYNYYRNVYLNNGRFGDSSQDFSYVKSERKAIKIFKNDLKTKRRSGE